MRDELEKTQQQLAHAAEPEHLAPTGDKDMREQAEGLAVGLQKTQDEAAELRSALQREREAHAKLHRDYRTVTSLRDHLSRRNGTLTRIGNELRDQARKAQHAAEQRGSALQQANKNLEEQRRVHHRRVERHAEELETLKSQAAARDAALVTLRSRAEDAERTLQQRDDDLSQQKQSLAAATRAHEEVHLVADSESRSLLAEKNRRVAAERLADS